MNFKLKILSILTLLSLNCFAMDRSNSNDELAQCKKLATEAQLTIGIPLEKHAQVKKMFPNDPHYIKDDAYVNYDNSIYVNMEKFNKYPYGYQRCTMFHEAVHVKYNDCYNVDLIGRECRADDEGLNATQCFMCVQEKTLYPHSEESEKEGYLGPNKIKKIAEELRKQNKFCAVHKPDTLLKKVEYFWNSYTANMPADEIETYQRLIASTGVLAVLGGVHLIQNVFNK